MTAKAWATDRLTGKALYDYADTFAQSLGYSLNPKMAGHRLGDFPHALYSKDQLSALEFSPATNLWVLEILIVSPEIQRGAFYEDILSH